MDFILMVYGSNKEQDKFVIDFCEKLSEISDESVRYFYGRDSVIVTLKTQNSLDKIGEKVDDLFKNSPNIIYILLPFERDKMSYRMTEEASEHLFGDKIIEENRTIDSYSTNELASGIIEFLNEISKNDIEILDVKVEFVDLPENVLTLDQILDKINDTGIESLTNYEKDLLEQYSK